MVINMCKIIKEKIKMLFGKKPYPILPTSESDTLTFLQKLDMLEYKVSEMNNKLYEIETSLATKSSVSATASGDVLQTITIDGTTLDVPQGTEVSATGSEGTLETLTVDGTTYNVPQESGLTGTTVDLESGWAGNDAVLERGGHTCVLKIFARYVTGGDICVIPEGYRSVAAGHAVGTVIRGIAAVGVVYVGIQSTGQVAVLATYGTTLQENDYINVQSVWVN